MSREYTLLTWDLPAAGFSRVSVTRGAGAILLRHLWWLRKGGD